MAVRELPKLDTRVRFPSPAPILGAGKHIKDGQLMITVYVLQSRENGKKYVGITNDLQRRMREHRSAVSKAGQILGDFELIFTEEYGDYSSARKREKFLKSGKGRELLKNLLDTRPARGG